MAAVRAASSLSEPSERAYTPPPRCDVIRGSCLCREVRYEITGELEEMHHCHCSRCRKAHGAAFSTFARTARSHLRLVSGERELRQFQSSPPVRRSFCARCGSSLFFEFAGVPEAIWVAVGTFDDDPGMRPGAHIFVGSRAPWHAITDDLPRHEEYPTPE